MLVVVTADHERLAAPIDGVVAVLESFMEYGVLMTSTYAAKKLRHISFSVPARGYKSLYFDYESHWASGVHGQKREEAHQACTIQVRWLLGWVQ